MNATLQYKYSTNDKKRPIVPKTDDINVTAEKNLHWKISVTLEKKNIYIYIYIYNF